MLQFSHESEVFKLYLPQSISCFYMQIAFKTKGSRSSLIARINSPFRLQFTDKKIMGTANYVGWFV